MYHASAVGQSENLRFVPFVRDLISRLRTANLRKMDTSDETGDISFYRWGQQAVMDTFGLKFRENLPELDAWLNEPAKTSKTDLTRLKHLAKRLIFYSGIWTEDELKMQFIAPLLDLVDFEALGLQLFSGRKLVVEVNGQRLSGEPDCLVGRTAMDLAPPLFCLMEYKPQSGGGTDPYGQILAAMVATQGLNGNEFPIFGTLVSGRLWTFLVLKGKDYAISRGFCPDTPKSAADVLGILRNLDKVIPLTLRKAA